MVICKILKAKTLNGDNLIYVQKINNEFNIWEQDE